jgi:hypothetical protein
MHAIISAVSYQVDNPPSEASAEGFAALIIQQPGYRGRFGLDAGGGERVHIYLFDSADAARNGLGGDVMRSFAEKRIRPHYAGPSERIAAGTTRFADLASILTGMIVRLELLPADSEGALTQESGYLGHVTVESSDGQPIIAAIFDATRASASLTSVLRTWEGAVTVNDWRPGGTA